MAQDDGFLSRWSRRKEQARQGAVLPDAPATVAAPAPAEVPSPARVAPSSAAPAQPAGPAPEPAPPLPTLDEVAALTHESDFARFVAPEVSGEVRNAALKKLFSDPHFNVMDGLDTYIDDYNKPDPLPASMLAKMAQAAYLGLVEEEPARAHAPVPPQRSLQAPPNECAADDVSAAVPPAAIPVAAEMKPHDEDPDLRLQSLDDPGPPGAEPGAGEDARGQR